MPSASPTNPAVNVDALVERAREFAAPGERHIVGIVGGPGAGKSTLAEYVATAVGDAAVVVPMDGLHLAHAELERLGRVERKGALDTFDADGLVALIQRLADNHDAIVYAPEFDRSIENPIAGAIPVAREVPLVIVEGLYLLVDVEPWARLASILDETWFIELDDATRLSRLIARHERFGRSLDDAQRHAMGSDQTNAEIVAASSARATLRVQLDGWSNNDRAASRTGGVPSKS